MESPRFLSGSQALIHTSDVNLANLPTLTGTITSLIGSQWETVMHADIIGTSSNAYKIDNEDPQSNSCKYSLAQGIATTLLMSSIGGSQNKGLNIEQFKNFVCFAHLHSSIAKSTMP